MFPLHIITCHFIGKLQNKTPTLRVHRGKSEVGLWSCTLAWTEARGWGRGNCSRAVCHLQQRVCKTQVWTLNSEYIKQDSSVHFTSTKCSALNCNLFIYFWLCWVFIAARAFLWLWRVRAALQSRCTGFTLQWLLLWQSMGSRHAGTSSHGTWAQQLWILVVHRLSCSVACGIFPSQR